MFITFKHSLLTAGAASLLSLGNWLLASPSYAITLDFASWDKIGDVTQVKPNAQANSGTSLTAFIGGGDDSLEEFLEIDAGSLDILDPEYDPNDPFPIIAATFGSAIRRNLVVQAGDKLSFNWDLTLAFDNELNTFDLDKAFVTIKGIEVLIKPLNTKDINGNDILSGKYEYTFSSAGNFLVGIGIVDINDAGGTSQLIVSNGKLQPVPEPLTLLGIFTGLGCGLVMRSRFGKQC
ncbi:PEP-CTERM putative exosortase interaction domain-containing protein [Nostoc sp. PCC 7524]|uniref:PEP-CTERM sorting domain-containing protein n=1 Tax=Nostoc sp. (strain ATCC 29411 / PCC 7524) TaxID=28072 RepID=UPI00029F4813|nr:PEP-CTERM sorting domain-containing protein [Nostoc sp. PCC 7524]AFY49068.1 PEP-CTERM putative exosortase interaction domain-containing protein [Nostoc sp. PCC 7524]